VSHGRGTGGGQRPLWLGCSLSRRAHSSVLQELEAVGVGTEQIMANDLTCGNCAAPQAGEGTVYSAQWSKVGVKKSLAWRWR
jgi:hypothetical protein